MIERSYCRQLEEQNPGGQVHNIFHLNVVTSLFGQTSQQQSCKVVWSNTLGYQVHGYYPGTLGNQVQGLRNYSGSREVLKLCPKNGQTGTINSSQALALYSPQNQHVANSRKCTSTVYLL